LVFEGIQNLYEDSFEELAWMSPLRREKKLFIQTYSVNSNLNLMDPVSFPNEKQTKRAGHAVLQDTGEHEAAGWI
jgi:hypothetical protein